MSIHGVYRDRFASDARLARTLRIDDMERYAAVPSTVMSNQWQDDLNWLIVDRSYPAQIGRREELLLNKRSMVIDRLPGEDVRAAELELRDTVADFILKTYPDYFKRDGNLVLSPLTGLAIDVGQDGADPLAAIALLASEDMLLLLPEKPGPDAEIVYRLKAGALLFPNGWALRSHFNQPEPELSQCAALEEWRAAKQKSLNAARLGKTPGEIHDGHVAHYMRHFASRVDMFFARMKPGQLTWRRNWAPRMSSQLFLHSDAPSVEALDLTPENWAEHGYLRSEHETFTKLSGTGTLVFGIKTYLWKLSELVKNPVALKALLTANDNLAPQMFEYRAASLPTFRQFLERHRHYSDAF
jgi:hypothetical protein